MIIPNHRLLLGVGVIFLPLSVLAFTADLFRTMYFVAGALFFMLAIIDVVLGFRRLEGLRLEFPELVHMSKGRETKVSIFLGNENRGDHSPLNFRTNKRVKTSSVMPRNLLCPFAHQDRSHGVPKDL